MERRHSEEKIAIIDESILAQDLRNSIIAALEAANEKKEKDLGWEIGFFLGFIQSNLNSHWCNEYLEKRSNDYKMIVMLQAANKLLMQRRGVVDEIQLQYRSDIKKDCNFQGVDSRIRATLPAVQMQMEMPALAKIQNTLDSDFFTCFDNITTERILAFANMNRDNYLPELEEYFTAKTVTRLLDVNRLAAGDV